MKKTYIIALVIVAAGIVVAVLMVKHAKKVSYAKNISKKTGQDYTKYMSGFATDFLLAWSNAVTSATDTFTYGGEGYSTATGTAVGASGD